MFQKIISTLIFLLAIPFFKFAFNIMLNKMENFFEEKNPSALSFFKFYAKVVRFTTSYIIPIILIIVIISIWINI